MRRILLAGGLAAMAAILVPSAPEAQPRSASGDCRAMSQSYGPQKLWWGRFSGSKTVMGFGDIDPVETYTGERCFTSKQSCDRWLYELKSEYQTMPRWNDCRQGFRPGEPVPAWWAPKRRG